MKEVMEEASRGIKLSDTALEVCKIIAGSGEDVFVVGGVLRDILSSRTTGDVDLATTATPKKMMTLFNRVVPTGIKHGTVTVLVGKETFEVTTLRGEGTYSDGRRPDSVTYLHDIEQDLARRDFTVNAIAWDPIRERLHDPFDGRGDLSKCLLRAVGDPVKRFKEDGLRVLRAARFCATHKFEIEANTAAAIPLNASILDKVASERKRDELKKILSSDRPSLGLEVIRRGGLLPFLSADLDALSEEIWSETLRRIDNTKEDLWIRLGAIFFDVGADRKESADLCERWLRKMRFDKKTISRVPHLIRSCSVSDFDGWSDADVRRFVRNTGKEFVPRVMELLLVDDQKGSRIKGLSSLRDRALLVIERGYPLSAEDLAISGKEIIQELGIAPGPEIGVIIDALVEHVLETPEDNQPAILLNRARELLDSR